MAKGKKRRNPKPERARAPEPHAAPSVAPEPTLRPTSATAAPPTAAAPTASGPASAALTRRDLAFAIGIAALALVAFWPARSFDFVNIDDPNYLSLVPQVRAGLSAQTVRWALTAEHACNWHPLTTLSYLAESSVFGLSRGGPFHVTNILLHALGGALLFIALRLMTAATYRSAFVAAVFVLHPLRVESVAWISERKDVLSGTLMFATLIAYARYARRPTRLKYLIVALVFALGLMSKAMLVTLPFVLLLLDRWPLQRATPWRRLVIEKLPLIALSAASSVVTFVIQRDCGAMSSVEMSAVGARFSNAAISYVRYLTKTLWPTDLTVLYVYRDELGKYPLNLWPLALLVLLAVTAAALWQHRRRPYLAVGWLWYIGMLVPVIGIVQVGQQAMADRYTYLPLIGIYVAVAWGVAEPAQARRWPREVLGGAAAVVLFACWVVTHAQLQHWRNSETVFAHGLSVTPDNATFRLYLGDYYSKQKRYDDAIRQLEMTVQLDPNFAEAWLNLGATYSLAGDADRALKASQIALRRFAEIRRNHPHRFVKHHVQALQNLGLMHLRAGDFAAARGFVNQSIAIQRDNAELHTSLGVVERAARDYDAAEAALRRALELAPNHAPAELQLALVRLDRGDFADAAQRLERAVRAQPDAPEIRYQHGVALARLRRFDEAAGEFDAVAAAQPKDARPHFQLGVLAHDRGDDAASVRHYRRALELDPRSPARNNLAWTLATSKDATVRNGEEAVEKAVEVREQLGPRPEVLDTLAAAFAEAGNFARAVSVGEEALRLAEQSAQPQLAAALRKRLALYRTAQPYREP